VLYRPSQAGAGSARRLFRFAGAFAPEPGPGEIAWEAEAAGRLVGAVIVERHGEQGMIHGPVVVEPPADVDALEVAAQLVAPLTESGLVPPLHVLYARPQGLDRVWVRFGFVPVPEAVLPESLRGRPGTGLHLWRQPGTYAVAMPQDAASRRRR
jgi:hypothetical protein